MAEDNELTYAALISVLLPNGKGSKAHIILTPVDRVEQLDQVKPLRDCTLADLQVFADALESEVWETYHQIRLLDLVESHEIQIKVTVEDKQGQVVPLPRWWQQGVLLESVELNAEAEELPAQETELAEPMLEIDETAEDTSAATVKNVGTTETVDDVSASADVAPATDEAGDMTNSEPLVTVSQSEPVYPEREMKDDPHAYPTPAIAPSQARVRIAGRRLPINHPTEAAVDILIDEPALRATQAHALSSLDREVAGVLLGPPPEKQPDGRYVVHVFDSVIARYTVMQGASVTYTPESWRYMHDKLAERYPDGTAVMVGWYHTHPGFGIFLSGMDQFIHQNFFTQIWHIALVLDPRASKSGFFCWDRQQRHVNRYEFGWPDWAAGSW